MRAVLALLLLTATLASGCGRRSQGAAAAGAVAAELTTSPRTPTAMRPVTLRLRFIAQGNVAVESLEVKASMAEMAHGADRVTFRSTGRSVFEASHIFSMDGEWELQVRATVSGKVLTTRMLLHVGGE